MHIEKIIINTKFTELGRKTHLQIDWDNNSVVLKTKFDTNNKCMYCDFNNNIQEVKAINLGEIKHIMENHFIINFNLKNYSVENNLIICNE